MPELPEVQTTVDGLNRTVKNRIIVDVWTDYESLHKMHTESIKNPPYFKKFKKLVVGKTIKRITRRAKNILIQLSGDYTILVHMKMTGHFVYDAKPGYPFVHLSLTLNNKKQLVFSDMRKFAKIALIQTSLISTSPHLAHLGPEPLDKSFTYNVFKERALGRSQGKVKQVLMDQSVVVGIGNIYADEILWRAGVHPLSRVGKIPNQKLKLMYSATIETLKKGIDFGGDSTSDYRNIKGERGEFQTTHNAYQKHKTKCVKRGCNGTLLRIVIGGRSAHFCPVHQKLFE